MPLQDELICDTTHSSVEEDYFLPVRGGDTNTRIENLPGGTFTGDIDDVKYF